MTRTEIQKRITEIVTDLTFAAERDQKHESVADALMALHDAIVFRTEREFAEHCRTFDARETLARLDAASRARRNTGPLETPPGERR